MDTLCECGHKISRHNTLGYCQVFGRDFECRCDSTGNVVKVMWLTGARDSTDGRWSINVGSVRNGKKHEREYYLYDHTVLEYRKRTRGVFDTAAEARAYAQEIVDDEIARRR